MNCKLILYETDFKYLCLTNKKGEVCYNPGCAKILLWLFTANLGYSEHDNNNTCCINDSFAPKYIAFYAEDKNWDMARGSKLPKFIISSPQ